jgi:uncharacterized membrane protein required for colicin V production
MDLIFLFSILILGTVGFFRGFFKETLGLVSFVCSICLSIALNKLIVQKTLFMIEEPLIASTVAYILGFLIILFLFTIFNLIVIKIFKLEHPSIFIKILGGLIGILKAYLFCLLIYCIVYSFILVTKNYESKDENTIKKMEQSMPKFFTKSKTFSYFIASIEKIDRVIQSFILKNKEKTKKESLKEYEEKSKETEDLNQKENEIEIKNQDKNDENKLEIKKESENLHKNQEKTENQEKIESQIEIEKESKLEREIEKNLKDKNDIVSQIINDHGE